MHTNGQRFTKRLIYTMKKISLHPGFLLYCLLALFSFRIAAPVRAQSRQAFYYYFDQKISLSEVPGAVMITFSNERGFRSESLPTELESSETGLAEPNFHGPIHACRYQTAGQHMTAALRARLQTDERIHNIAPVYRNAEGDELLVADRIILRAKEASWETMLLNRCGELGLELSEVLDLGGETDVFVFKTPRFANPIDLGNQLQETGLAVFAHADFSRQARSHHTPNDPNHGSQWFLHQSSDRDIDAREAWDITKGNSSVVVAVVDGSGYDMSHEDMTGKYIAAYDAVNNDNDPSPENQYANHGTPCAGLVGANTNNSKGVASIGYAVKVLPIVIGYNSNSNNGFQTSSEIITRAAQRIIQTAGVVAVSNSWGGGGYFAAEEQAYNAMRTNSRSGKGAVVLASTGNDGQNKSQRPANYSGVIGVGSSNESDYRTASSNYGDILKVMVPGNNTLAPDRSGYAGYASGNYYSFGGTSAACPIAAGVVGLIASVNTNLTGAQLAEILQTTTEKVGGYSYSNQSSKPLGTWNVEMGYGRINALNAVRRAAKPTLTVSAISGGSATANWNAINGATNYSLRYKLTSASTWTTVTVSGTSRNITGLSGSSIYHAQVVANFGSTSVQGEWSDLRNFGSGGGGGTCNVPTSLTSFSVAQTTATLDWADVSGASGGYQVRLRASGASTWIDLGTTSNSQMGVIYMTPGTTYEWQVRTICSGSTTSNYASSAWVTTLSNAPGNDNPCTATVLSSYSAQNWTTGNNSGATSTYSGSTCGTSLPRDVWYATPIPASGFVSFRTAAGSLDDGVMAVYWGSCNSLSYIVCEDDNFTGNAMPAVVIQGQPGTWIYVRMWGYDNDQGTFGICALNFNSGDFSEPGAKVYQLPSFAGHSAGPMRQEPQQASEQPTSVPTETTERSVAPNAGLAQVGQVFPNPALTHAVLPYSLATADAVRIQIFDAMGRLVLNQSSEQVAGDYQAEIALGSWAAGTYFVRFQSGETVRVQKLEVECGR